MTISLVVNSGALALHAEDTKSSGGVPYSWRSFALRNFILPAYCADPHVDEVIVAGVWEDGPGYTYVPVLEGRHGSWKDCIAQRQAGFEASTGDIVIHQHDDHFFDTQLAAHATMPSRYPDVEMDWEGGTWSVLVPQRWTRLRNPAGERLNHGEPVTTLAGMTADGFRVGYDVSKTVVPLHDGYVGGHCAIYRREVLERCPWKNVPMLFTMDVAHTDQIRAAGFTIAYSESLKVWDVERGSEPWR